MNIPRTDRVMDSAFQSSDLVTNRVVVREFTAKGRVSITSLIPVYI